MIAFVKDYWKSSLLGTFGALVLLCIGVLVYDRLTLDATQEAPNTDTHNTAKLPPPGEHMHVETPHAPPPKIKRVRPKTNARPNRVLKNIGPILPSTSAIPPPPLLPVNIQSRLDQIYREMVIAGTMYEIRDDEKVVTEAAHKRRYDILVGGMTPEDAVIFLETYQIYNPLILDELEPRRAIDYLYQVRVRWKEKETYAMRVLARDPNNPDAQVVLLSAEPDDAVAAAGYRNIVAKYPNDLRALNALGYRLHYDDPEEAIQHLKKVNNLDTTRGLFSLGLAYERLGDLKTAWLYYRKQQTIQNGNLVELHKRAIELSNPLYAPISRTSSPIPEADVTPLDNGTVPHGETSPPVPEETPWLSEFPSKEHHTSENQLTDKERRKVERTEAARAEFQRQQAEFLRQQAGSQQELEEFLKWAESIMNAEDSVDFNDFLSKEFTAHLKNDDALFEPERTVRAYEMIERYGPKEGLQRLKEKDPELAKQMEQFIEDKHPSRRNNSQNRK